MTIYNDYDWDELPSDAKEAAKTLGYNKSTWDKQGFIKIEEYDWDELSKKQQNAAIVLGYNKASWDE
eukprot:CAMPEP_0184861932 /NCGR_PEP_ID=MMETSP0580-20130426/6512_1 /TAXON_ID=1118495 /ORGANISM="Dactyliosolen fragilissimus" /LENGTH=66 /DNA_ID=CAMNT_0027359613 /DNA_START=156 /DNA_END=356 /DNA_ORIENTATION=+